MRNRSLPTTAHRSGCIINAWLTFDGDSDPIRQSYRLSEEALRAALAYYRQHKHVIDARIALEEDEWGDSRNDQGREEVTARAKHDQELIARWIETDTLGPREARLRGYGVSAWALIAHWRGIGGDIDETARDYNLPREAVEAMLALYRRYQKYIDAQILLNEAAFEDWSTLGR